MYSILKFAIGIKFSCLVAVGVGLSQDQPNARSQQSADAVKATQAEPQTAEWAKGWWMDRHKQKLAEKKEMERVDLVMIGDSITHSWESQGKAVWNEYYAKRNALNVGFGGDRTENVIWRLRNGAVDGISPKLAIVMIGTNNAGHRKDKPEHTAAGIKKIISELQARLPDTKILLVGIFPRGATADDPLRKLNVATNSIIKKYADNQKVWYLDIGGKFVDKNGDLPKKIMPDLLHPNAEGYRIWAQAMEPKVVELMEGN